MFDADRLAQAIELQERSYRLLKWIGGALRDGKVSFDTAHATLSLADAGEEWIQRHLDNIPADCRPGSESLRPFAQLFVSYLSTSFELVAKPKPRLVSTCGCYCSFCSYLGAGKNLKPRRITPGARRDATELKRLYLKVLAEEAGFAARFEADDVIHRTELAEDVSWATYGRELLRRMEFASQGPGILVLWREIAWLPSGAMRPGFKLSAPRMLTAEQRLLLALDVDTERVS